MPNEKTPEDRLREYKKFIAQMAVEDKKQTDDATDGHQRIDDDTTDTSEPRKAGPPRNLQSPAKQELRSSLGIGVSSSKSLMTGTDSPHKARVMLKARQLAIEASLRDIKSRKERLELLFERKLINREEYEKRRQEIVKEGQELLREKAEVDAKLSG